MKRLTFASLLLILVGGCSERNPLFVDDAGPDPDGYIAPDHGLLPDSGPADDSFTPPPPLDGAPGDCTSNPQCGAGMYCRFESGCGQTGPGTCAARPTQCPEYYSPTCGCDGVTYGNPCDAASAGVSVASPGECAPPQKTCNELNQDYIAAVKAAQQCAPGLPVLQCQVEVDNALHCACPTHVEQGNTAAIAKLKQIKQQFDSQGCVAYQCGMPCWVSTPGNCAPLAGGTSGACE